MSSLAPPKHTKTPTAAHRNVIERRDESLIVVLIKTYKSRADTPRLKSTGILVFAFEYALYGQKFPFERH